MRFSRLNRLLLIPFLALAAAISAQAGISGLYSTGVDADGEPLPSGARDRHYEVILSPGDQYGPETYRLANGFPVDGPWVTNDESDESRWISVAPENPGSWFPIGPYEFATTFELSEADLQTARIVGRWASDGNGADIRLNGETVPSSSNEGFGGFTSFTIDSGFVQGTNILVFPFYNPQDESPAGLRVEMDGEAISQGSIPFFTSLGEHFDEPLNRMWRIYGSVSDGTDAVFTFGNEPAFFEWMARKLMWSDQTSYKNGLFTRIREFPMSEDGYAWSWANRPDWPTEPGALHQENNAKYILSLYRYFMWTRDDAFLTTQDTTTTTSVSDYPYEDVSQGMTMLEKMRLAMSYQLNKLDGQNGLLVIENDHNTGLPDGAPTNYWDNFPFGYKDAYSNAYFHASVLAMAEIEEYLGETAAAAGYRELADKIRRRYTEEFWDLRKGRFVGAIDETGRVWDFGFTFLNTEALVYGLGDSRLADSIFSWLDGGRIIESDTSTGSDIYTFGWAPRATTLDAAAFGEPYWWKSINNQITVGPGGTATYGEHLENGGAIFYTSHYDILARAQYQGADDAWERLAVIMDEFAIDELRRDPPNNVGAAWKFGIIGEFPESGLVPATFLYAFLGIDADVQGLNIRPNLPAALDYGGVHNLAYGDGLYRVTVWPDRVEIEPDHPTGQRLPGVVGNFPPGAPYRLVVEDLANGEKTVAAGLTNPEGEFPFDVTVQRGVRVTIEPDE